MNHIQQAKYDGQCFECSEFIGAGDAFYWLADRKWACETCWKAISEGPERFREDGFGKPEY